MLPNTCYPRKSINNIPHGIAPQHRRICDSDEKCKHQSEEYKNHMTARGHHPGLVDKKFQKARKKNTKRSNF